MPIATKTSSEAVERLRGIVRENRGGRDVGVCSVCSAHPWVLDAAFSQATEDGTLALVEATSNQVNQFGGYTGKTPEQYATELYRRAGETGLPTERLVLGGDHLGPYPWRRRPGEEAMANACAMVRDYVLAGFVKIHLDASMPCADDPPAPLDPGVAAKRAAAMCAAAEKANGELPAGSPPPVYVIGTEVPVPGGEQAEAEGPVVTKVEDAASTIETHRAAFEQHGLSGALDRVIGLVVQPGVEFTSDHVYEFDPAAARLLSENLPSSPELVYEAHSTDYQTAAGLRQLVQGHFAILKVGPWLTFALREALFALDAIEREWLAGRGAKLSNVPGALEQAMLGHPDHWKDYYTGSEAEQHMARRYSLSDRCRYYWPVPEVRQSLDVLVRNLEQTPAPLPLLSQFLPVQYERVRAGRLPNRPVAIIQDRIRDVLRLYSQACGVV